MSTVSVGTSPAGHGRYCRAPWVQVLQMEEGSLLLNGRWGTYWLLDGRVEKMWRSLNTPKSEAQLRAILRGNVKLHSAGQAMAETVGEETVEDTWDRLLFLGMIWPDQSAPPAGEEALCPPQAARLEIASLEQAVAEGKNTPMWRELLSSLSAALPEQACPGTLWLDCRWETDWDPGAHLESLRTWVDLLECLWREVRQEPVSVQMVLRVEAVTWQKQLERLRKDAGSEGWEGFCRWSYERDLVLYIYFETVPTKQELLAGLLPAWQSRFSLIPCARLSAEQKAVDYLKAWAELGLRSVGFSFPEWETVAQAQSMSGQILEALLWCSEHQEAGHDYFHIYPLDNMIQALAANASMARCAEMVWKEGFQVVAPEPCRNREFCQECFFKKICPIYCAHVTGCPQDPRCAFYRTLGEGLMRLLIKGQLNQAPARFEKRSRA